MKDEPALDAFLTNTALDGSIVHLSSGELVSGEVLERLFETYRAGRAVADKLYRIFPYEALHGMLFIAPLSISDLAKRERMEVFASDLAAQLPSDPKKDVFQVLLSRTQKGQSSGLLSVSNTGLQIGSFLVTSSSMVVILTR